MVMTINRSHATLSDHGGIIYSPFLFAARRDLSQSAGAPRQLLLPPPGPPPKERRKRKGKRKKETEKTVGRKPGKPNQGKDSHSLPAYSFSAPSSSPSYSPSAWPTSPYSFLDSSSQPPPRFGGADRVVMAETAMETRIDPGIASESNVVISRRSGGPNIAAATRRSLTRRQQLQDSTEQLFSAQATTLHHNPPPPTRTYGTKWPSRSTTHWHSCCCCQPSLPDS